MKRIELWFDVKAAILGALLMALVIGMINSGHGLNAAMLAAVKQAVYTFCFAGLISRFCRGLVVSGDGSRSAIIKAVVFPTLITIALISLVHGFRGTAEPLYSIAAVSFMAFAGFFGMALNEARSADTDKLPAE